MRKATTIVLALMLLLVIGSAESMAAGPFGTKGDGTGNAFAYFYQWLRDSDGDGVPNGLDPDWVRPEDGTGYGRQNGGGDGCDDCEGAYVRDRDRDRDRDNEGSGAMTRNSYSYWFRNKKGR
ncbi:MAG: hypothetical protein JSV33_02210 [bacterium]|nr:MAG: hypothetical protein JSV33_02210 [bacterium]